MPEVVLTSETQGLRKIVNKSEDILVASNLTKNVSASIFIVFLDFLSTW